MIIRLTNARTTKFWMTGSLGEGLREPLLAQFCTVVLQTWCTDCVIPVPSPYKRNQGQSSSNARAGARAAPRYEFIPNVPYVLGETVSRATSASAPRMLGCMRASQWREQRRNTQHGPGSPTGTAWGQLSDVYTSSSTAGALV